jgi:hypothetical protein
LELFVSIELRWVVNKVLVAIYTFFLITWPRIQNCSVGQHGSPFIRDIEDISMALLALFILHICIGVFPGLFMVISVLNKMHDHILDPMSRFGIEKVKSVFRGREMTVHAICHKALGIVRVGRGLPCIVSKLVRCGPW